ncbi:MAG: hypothetical protein ACK5HT_19995 [Draconibacterium sp.]
MSVKSLSRQDVVSAFNTITLVGKHSTGYLVAFIHPLGQHGAV